VPITHGPHRPNGSTVFEEAGSCTRRATGDVRDLRVGAGLGVGLDEQLFLYVGDGCGLGHGKTKVGSRAAGTGTEQRAKVANLRWLSR